MKFTHSVKFQLNKQYEMHEMNFEASEDDFPEIQGKSFTEKARYIQGSLIMQGLLFKVATGYLNPKSPEFIEARRMALELKGDVTKEV